MVSNPQKGMIRSPLRYPGGKGAFATFFIELIKKNRLEGGKYVEPFAGGAGVALGLLSSGVVSEVIINDADYHIYSFWKSVLNDTERFIEEIKRVEVTINQWRKQKKIYEAPNSYTIFEVGFSTFYLNRCNRSGILAGAGPIGGYGQQGKWRLNARFNKNNLITRIFQIGKYKDKIVTENMDAIDCLSKYINEKSGGENMLVYVDPPYVSAGNRLYLNTYLNADHRQLANYLLNQRDLIWVATYDNNILIRELYGLCQKWLFGLGYSLQSKQRGKELLIAPKHVELPNKNEVVSKRWNLIEKITS